MENIEKKVIEKKVISSKDTEEEDGYIKVPFLFGLSGNKKYSNVRPYIKLVLSDELPCSHSITLQNTYNLSNDKDLGIIDFLNYKTNNIFQTLDVGKNVIVNCNCKFMYGVNSENGYKYFFIVLRIGKRHILIQVPTESNMTLDDSLDNKIKGSQFGYWSYKLNDRNTLIQEKVNPIKWVERKLTEDNSISIDLD